MTDVQETQPDAPPEPFLRGRFAAFEEVGGGWAVARADGICERCQECGCGVQQEPFHIPAMLVPFLTGQAELSPGGAMKLIKGMMGNGK